MSRGRPTSPEELLTHDAWVRGLARVLASDESLADDLAQEAWLTAIEKPPHRRESLRGWFATVLRNRMRTETRAQRRRLKRERARARSELVDPTSEAVVRAEAQQRVLSAVLGLPVHYRTVVMLRFFEGLTAQQIAKLHGLSASTVRTRLSRALQMLRNELERGASDRKSWRSALILLAAWPGRRAWSSFLPPTGAAVAALGLVLACLSMWWSPGFGQGNPARSASRNAILPNTPSPEEGRVLEKSRDREDDAEPQVVSSPESVLRVLDGRVLLPLAGVKVRVFVGHTPWLAELSAASDLSLESGDTVETDAHGLVRLPAYAGRALLCARKGNLAGRCFASSASRFTQLALHVDESVSVAVVDEAGEPVPGVLTQLLDATPWSRGVARRAYTNANGVALLRELHGHRESNPVVAIAAPGLRHTQPVTWPSGGVKLVLPRCGRIRVHVDTPDGVPVGRCTVRLSEGQGPNERSVCVPATGGYAEFPHVGLDEELLAEVFSSDYRTARTRFRGPSEADDVVIQRVVAGERRRQVCGRLVDESGHGLAAIHLAIAQATPRAGEFDWCVSDRNGGFRFHPGFDPADVDLFLESPAADGPRLVPLYRGVVPANGDLGDVKAGVAPQRARGMVEDERGEPIPGATVRVVSRGAASTSSAVTDVTGCFEVQGTGAGGEVIARAPYHLPASAATFGGERRSVRIVLSDAGAVIGRVLGGCSRREVGLEALDTAWRTTIDAEPDGAFACFEVPPGRVRVTVSGAGSRVIVVTAGKATRVSSFHITSTDSMPVRVTDSHGKPLARVRIWHRPKGGQEAWRAVVTDADGEAAIPGSTPQQVVAMKEGYRTATLETASRGFEIALDESRASEVRISLELPGGMENDPVVGSLVWLGELGAARKPAADPTDPRNLKFTRIEFNALGEASIRVADPGVYGVSLWWEERSGDEIRAVALEAPMQTFEVDGRGGTVHVRTSANKNLLEAAKRR